MPVGRPMLFRNPAGHSGLIPNLTSLVASLTQFLESRLKLAARESKQAIRHLVTLVASLIAALVIFAFGYVFLIVFLVAEVAHLLNISWFWIALVLALLHFMAALFCLLIARGQIKHPIFRETADVLKEDTEWLKNLDQTKLP